LDENERKTIHEILLAIEKEYRDAPMDIRQWKPTGLPSS
jgi:hypothetical protein